MQNNHVIENTQTSEHVLNIRLEEAGWALFLIMLGALWLLPAELVPSHAWLIGAVVIMVGVNFARAFAGIKMSDFTVFVGVVALVAGLSEFFAVELPIFAALFIVLGSSLLTRALFKTRS